MTSVVLVTAEICLLTLCLGVEGATGPRVSDRDHLEFGGKILQKSIDLSEFSPLTLIKDSLVSGWGSRENRFRYAYGDDRIPPRNSRRATKKASIMGLDNLDFVIRTLNRSGNRLSSSIRHGSYYNAYQSSGRNGIGSSSRRSRERNLVDLIKAGKRSRQEADGGILEVEELDQNEDLET